MKHWLLSFFNDRTNWLLLFLYFSLDKQQQSKEGICSNLACDWRLAAGAYKIKFSNSIYLSYFQLRLTLWTTSMNPIKNSLRFFLRCQTYRKVSHFSSLWSLLFRFRFNDKISSCVFSSLLSGIKYSKYLELYLLSKATRGRNGTKKKKINDRSNGIRVAQLMWNSFLSMDFWTDKKMFILCKWRSCIGHHTRKRCGATALCRLSECWWCCPW